MSYAGSVMVYENLVRAGVGGQRVVGEEAGSSSGRGRLARTAAEEVSRDGSVAATEEMSVFCARRLTRGAVAVVVVEVRVSSGSSLICCVVAERAGTRGEGHWASAQYQKRLKMVSRKA